MLVGAVGFYSTHSAYGPSVQKLAVSLQTSVVWRWACVCLSHLSSHLSKFMKHIHEQNEFPQIVTEARLILETSLYF